MAAVSSMTWQILLQWRHSKTLYCMTEFFWKQLFWFLRCSAGKKKKSKTKQTKNRTKQNQNQKQNNNNNNNNKKKQDFVQPFVAFPISNISY